MRVGTFETSGWSRRWLRFRPGVETLEQRCPPSICTTDEYTITDLGTLGGNSSAATGIYTDQENEHHITGRAELTPVPPMMRGPLHPFLSNGTVMHDLGNWPDPDTQGTGRGIYFDPNTLPDPTNYITGFVTHSDGAAEAFYWTGNQQGLGSYQMLGTFGGARSEGSDINSNLQLVGYADSSFLTPDESMGPPPQEPPTLLHKARPFWWSPTSGGKRDFGRPGCPTCAGHAWGINEAGLAVGDSDTTAQGGVTHAMKYRISNQRFDDLGTLGGAQAIAWEVNEDGDIVGVSDMIGSEPLAPNLRRGFFLPANGTLPNDAIVLAPPSNLPGYTFTSALDVNTSDRVVGCPAVAPEDEAMCNATLQCRATVYQVGDGENCDLNLMLTGVPPGESWILFQARAIDEAGNIVGGGIHTVGTESRARAFLLRPDLGANPQAPPPFEPMAPETLQPDADGLPRQAPPAQPPVAEENAGSEETPSPPVDYPAARMSVIRKSFRCNGREQNSSISVSDRPNQPDSIRQNSGPSPFPNSGEFGYTGGLLANQAR
jgi:hypothetical protein